IAYSLGNFCTYSRFNLKGENGIAPIVKVYTNSEGEFLEGQIFPIVQLGEGGPVPDDQKRVIFKMKELTETDFPEAKITITESGKILLKK
ncbi:MAG TPA: CapA family protein, partial [Cytophagaceae bacterium]